MWCHRDQGRRGPGYQPPEQRPGIFSEYKRGHLARQKTDRPEQREFGLTFPPDVAQHHGRESEGAQQQAQSAERLKVERYVFCTARNREPFGRRFGVEAVSASSDSSNSVAAAASGDTSMRKYW